MIGGGGGATNTGGGITSFFAPEDAANGSTGFCVITLGGGGKGDVVLEVGGGSSMSLNIPVKLPGAGLLPDSSSAGDAGSGLARTEPNTAVKSPTFFGGAGSIGCD